MSLEIIILNEVAQEENSVCFLASQILASGVYICRSVGVRVDIGCEMRTTRKSRSRYQGLGEGIEDT